MAEEMEMDAVLEELEAVPEEPVSGGLLAKALRGLTEVFSKAKADADDEDNADKADADDEDNADECPECGADVVAGSKFCGNCGTKLSKALDAETTYAEWTEDPDLAEVVEGNEVLGTLLKGFATTLEEQDERFQDRLEKAVKTALRPQQAELASLRKSLDALAEGWAIPGAVPQGPGRPAAYEVLDRVQKARGGDDIPPHHEVSARIINGLKAGKINKDEGHLLSLRSRNGMLTNEDAVWQKITA